MALLIGLVVATAAGLYFAASFQRLQAPRLPTPFIAFGGPRKRLLGNTTTAEWRSDMKKPPDTFV